MPSLMFSAARVLVIAGVLAVALAACGRRGPPEAPPDASVPQQGTAQTAAGPASADDTDDEDPVVATPVPAPRPARNAKRGYTIPKDPFVLDPLL